MKTINLQGLCECVSKTYKNVSEDLNENSDKLRETFNLKTEDFIIISINYFSFISMIFYYFYFYLNIFISLFLLTIELRETVELHAKNAAPNSVICRKLRGSFV
jgi:hypothetical protein